MPAASSAAEPTNSSNIVSQTEPGSPNADTGGDLAPPSPDRRNTVSFGSDNSSVAESDGTTELLLSQGLDNLSIQTEVKRRKKTPPLSDEQEQSMSSAPTGPATTVPAGVQQALENFKETMSEVKAETPSGENPQDETGDAQMTEQGDQTVFAAPAAASSSDQSKRARSPEPEKFKVDLDDDGFDPADPFGKNPGSEPDYQTN